jgi:hypothetical protein
LSLEYFAMIRTTLFSPEIDSLSGQQAVTFCRIGQWENVESTLVFAVCEIVFVDLCVYFHVRERTGQHKEVNVQRILSFCLQRNLRENSKCIKKNSNFKDIVKHLISNHSIVALMNVALRVVDDRLHNPLMIECREASRFEEEFCEILIRAIRLCLQICHEKRLFQKLSQEISLIVIESEFNFSRNSGLDCRDCWRGRWSLL